MFSISPKNWPFLELCLYWIVPYWQLFLSYQGKRISNCFKIVSSIGYFNFEKSSNIITFKKSIKVTPSGQLKLPQSHDESY